MAQVMKSKPVTDALIEEMRPRITELKMKGITPKLATLRVGDRPDDVNYERAIAKRLADLGMIHQPIVLSAEASQQEVAYRIHQVNEDYSIHGCLMFRPLSKHLDEKALCNMLAVEKDVDGISLAAMGSLFTQADDGFAPSTAEACIRMLDYYGVDLEGKNVVVVGRSLVIGKPVSMMLLDRNATVAICHSHSEKLHHVTRAADVVVLATGQPRAYDADYFTSGQIVVDVGINFDSEGSMCGDVDFDAVEPIVDAITPVPGGIGALTSTITLLHTLEAAEHARTR